MEVTVENTGGLERRMKVEIPEDKVESEVGTRLTSLAKTAKLPGFRPGKVPMKVVIQRFGRQVREEVVGELVKSSFYDAVTSEKLRPASGPTIDSVTSDPGNGVAYTAVFEVYPDVSLKAVEGLEIKKPVAAVEKEDVDRMIDTLRQRHKKWQAVERAAIEGDRVIIDFDGTVDGETFEGGSGSRVPLELGSRTMVKGFEEGLIGVKAGEELSLSLQIPKDERAGVLAGKAVIFKVNLHEVEEGVLPEVDEEFARGFGVTEGGVERFRSDVRENMERELHDALVNQTKQRVMDALYSANPVDLPKFVVQQEVTRLLEQGRQDLRQRGIEPDNIGLDSSNFEQQGKRRVALGLLLAELISSNDVKADPEKVRARVELIASSFEDPNQVIQWYYGDRGRLAEIESAVLENQVVDWVLERAKVSEERTSFDELLNPGQTRNETP